MNASGHGAALLAEALARGANPAEELLALGQGDPLSAYGRAAADMGHGVALADALRRNRAFPEPYLVAFDAGATESVRSLAAAAGRVEEHAHSMRLAHLRAVGMLALVLVALVVGSAAILPPLFAWFQSHGVALPGLWNASAQTLLFCTRPASVLLITAGVAALGVLAWTHRIPLLGSRRVARAAACRALDALLRAGVSLERGLPLAARIAGHRGLARRLEQAAHRVGAGTTAAAALAQTDLAPGPLAELWTVAEPAPGAGGRLEDITAALAEVLEAEADALAPTAGRVPQMLYAGIAGLLTLWFALTAVWAWLEVLSWTA